MQLYVMRHGHTNYNELGLCNDDPSAAVHLTSRGEAQAQAAAEQLRDAALDRIIVSELPRTHETARIVNQHHHVPLDVHPALNDIVTGFDGRPVAEYFAATAPDRLHNRPPGGESLLDYKARVLSFFDWLRAQPWERVLVIAHEETLRVFTVYFAEISDAEMESLNFGNCEIVEFEMEASRDT